MGKKKSKIEYSPLILIKLIEYYSNIFISFIIHVFLSFIKIMTTLRKPWK